jgi:hypothetical protein
VGCADSLDRQKEIQWEEIARKAVQKSNCPVHAMVARFLLGRSLAYCRVPTFEKYLFTSESTRTSLLLILFLSEMPS